MLSLRVECNNNVPNFDRVNRANKNKGPLNPLGVKLLIYKRYNHSSRACVINLNITLVNNCCKYVVPNFLTSHLEVLQG